MIIRYFSDLHLEFIKSKNIEKIIKKINPGLDQICVIAGDVGNPYTSNYDVFMNFINNNFLRSYVIAGNHEYYDDKSLDNPENLERNSSIKIKKEYMFNYFKKFENVRFLDNEVEEYRGYTFVGTTLWSHIFNPIYEINDVHFIPNFDYSKYNLLHRECISFLENALTMYDNCIVITHHMPSNKLIHPKYKVGNMSKYNQWFYCDADYLITSKVKCWFYGHTHMPSETTINEVPLLCNPIGYPNENTNVNFNKEFMLDELNIE
jgi:predicted phosphodiesterase